MGGVLCAGATWSGCARARRGPEDCLAAHGDGEEAGVPGIGGAVGDEAVAALEGESGAGRAGVEPSLDHKIAGEGVGTGGDEVIQARHLQRLAAEIGVAAGGHQFPVFIIVGRIRGAVAVPGGVSREQAW